MAHGVILGQTPTLDTSNLVTQEQLNNTLNGYATTTQLNNYLLRSGGIMTGNINMGNHKITNVTNAVNNTDAVNLGQMNSALNNYATTAQLGNYLPLTGGTLNGQLNMNNSKITGLADGTEDTDAATIGQVNTLLSNQIPYIVHSSGNCIVSPTSAYLYKSSGNNVSYRFTDDEANIIASWLNINHDTIAWPTLYLYSVHNQSIGNVEMSSTTVTFEINANYVGTVLYYWN